MDSKCIRHNVYLDIYVTGSNSKFLSKDVLTEFAERTAKPQRDEKGYVTMGVKEFLLDLNSLEA